MKRDSSLLMIGAAVLLGVATAFGVAVKFAKQAHAQSTPPAVAQGKAKTALQTPSSQSAAAPTNELPPPTEAGVAPPSPAADLPPPPEEDTAQNGAGLDSSQDPGLKTINPEGYVYDPSGRRDPFFPPASLVPIPGHINIPTQGPVAEGAGPKDPFLAFNVNDYRLVAVLWAVQDPLAIVQTPEKQMLTLHLKMRLGKENAVVAAIRENEVLAVEPGETGDFKKGEIHRIRMKN